MPNKIVINKGTVILPNGLKATDIELSEGVISRVDSDIHANESDIVVNARGKYVLPGFIDIHTNGIAGFDLTLGVYEMLRDSFDSGEDVYLRGLDNALRNYATTGVSRAYLSSLASPVAELGNVFQLVRKYRDECRQEAWAGVLGGLYIEGTFMKDPAYRGAHNPDYFSEPSAELFDELQDAAGGLISIVNVVPEWGEPAYELIRYLTGKGLVCAAGHTGATGDEYARAVKSGTRLAVHFPNGPTGSSAKSFNAGERSRPCFVPMKYLPRS